MLPLVVAVISRPMTSGSIRNPELVALTPSTYWKKVGRNVIEPSIVKPTTKLRAQQFANTRDRKSRNGRIGSAARDSTSTKTPRTTSPPISSPAICHDRHG